MKFVEYRPGHLERVVEIFRSNIPKYFGPDEELGLLEFLSDARSHDYFVAELNGEIVGAGGVALNDDQTVSLCWGMVHADHLGKGMGRELTEFRIEEARERFGDLPLVISTSQHTKGFYEKLGFELVERVPDGFGPGLDACKMRL